MSLPDYAKHSQGTQKTWKSTGGDYAITMTSLLNGSGVQGAKGDLGSTWAQRWVMEVASSVASAATAGNEVEFYWGPSASGDATMGNPAGMTGSDGAWNPVDELKAQTIYVGSLVLSANLGTGIQRQLFEFYPPTRYGMPGVANKSGQTLGSTAANHEIKLTPAEQLVQDTV